MKAYHKYILILCLCSFIVNTSCTTNSKGISTTEFIELMNNIAIGWSTQNTKLALSSFTEDAIYMEPPDVQFFKGHSQLKPYFDALNSSHKMVFHNLWFNEELQTGSGEFTFSHGKDTSNIGIVVVELQNGKISHWREYFTNGPTNFEDFLNVENKTWQWHIGNYPVKKDTLNNLNQKK